MLLECYALLLLKRKKKSQKDYDSPYLHCSFLDTPRAYTEVSICIFFIFIFFLFDFIQLDVTLSWSSYLCLLDSFYCIYLV